MAHISASNGGAGVRRHAQVPRPRHTALRFSAGSRKLRVQCGSPAGYGGKELRFSFLAEFWAFLRVRKKYWLLPAVLTMLAFGGLIAITQTSAVAPMIYTIF